MKRLACLAILAGLTLPCTASDPAARPRMAPKPQSGQIDLPPLPSPLPPVPPPPLVDDDVVRAVIAPLSAVTLWAMDQTCPDLVPPPLRTRLITRGNAPTRDIPITRDLPIIPGDSFPKD
jgi:hypothetical protein